MCPFILQDNSLSVEEAIDQQKADSFRLQRSQPFVMKVGGGTLFLVVDNRSIIVRPNSLSVAFALLLK